MKQKLILLLLVLVTTVPWHARGSSPVGEWWFWPDYHLPRNATSPVPESLGFHQQPSGKVESCLPPVLLSGEVPTQRVQNLLSADLLRGQEFTIELWLLDHVNHPVGTMAIMRSAKKDQSPHWLLSYYGGTVQFAVGGEKQRVIRAELNKDRDWKHFLHIAAVYSDSRLSLYVNGKKEQTLRLDDDPVAVVGPGRFELAGYFNREEYMELSNLLKLCRVYDTGLSEAEIKVKFRDLQGMARNGFLIDRFHFNVRPYLSYATESSVSLTWETNEPSRAVVEYGTGLPLEERRRLEGDRRIHRMTLNGLAAATRYFYRIKAQDATGKKLETGLLSFSTALNSDEAVSFALFGDTEARPHINNRISQLVWEERPQFVINLGDMTDGGSKSDKHEWNYEYFVGMNALHGRIPVFPVPGNGDGDLFWFNRYHGLPGDEGYYSFRYGNAEFFMINSVARKDLLPGGRQYLWLERKLKESTATWKFACHHFAPYSSDENDYGDSWTGPTAWGDLQIRGLVPLYDRFGVDMVFYGHLHAYERSLPLTDSRPDPENGIVYVLTGGGGGNLEDFAPNRSPFTAKTYRGHHFCTVNILQGRLDFRMYDLEGRLQDIWQISK